MVDGVTPSSFRATFIFAIHIRLAHMSQDVCLPRRSQVRMSLFFLSFWKNS